MTDRIDLGAELADYNDNSNEPDFSSRQPTTRARLSDLQDQGFNRTPDHPSQVPVMWRGAGIVRDPNSWTALADATAGQNPPTWSTCTQCLPNCTQHTPGAPCNDCHHKRGDHS